MSAGPVPAGPQAQPRRLPLRAASHEGYGRIVFDWSVRVDYVAELSDDRLMLRFGVPATPITGGVRAPRNVSAIAAADGGVAITLRPGTRVRHFRLGNRIVVDVHDGGSATAESRRAERRSRLGAAVPAPSATPALPPSGPVAEAAPGPVPAPITEVAVPLTESIIVQAATTDAPAPVQVATPSATGEETTALNPAISEAAPVPDDSPAAVATALLAVAVPVVEPVALRAEPAPEPPAVGESVISSLLPEAAAAAPEAADTEGVSQLGAQAAATLAAASPVAASVFSAPVGGADDRPAALPISAEEPVETTAEADAAPTVVIAEMGDQPEMPLSAAGTAVSPIGTNVARPQPLVAATAAPERISLAPPAPQPATAEAPSTAPVAVAQPAQAPRQDGGTKAEETAAPVVAAAPPASRPAPAPSVARAPAPPAGRVVLVQQQPGLPATGSLPLQLTPGTTRIQVAPGQPIPPLLGGGATPAPVAPALAGPIPSDQRPALVPVPVMLEVGSGRLIQLPAPAAAVFAADPRVARVQPASPTSLFVMAVAAGRTNVIATGDDGTPIVEYDVSVAGRATGAAPAAAPSFAAPSAPVATGLPRPSVVESMIRRSIRGGEGVRVAGLAQRG